MALPLALALTSGGLSILGGISANKQAKRQFKFQKRLQALNAQIAEEQANRTINQIRQRQIQERAQLAQQTQEITDRAREALGVSVAQAAETGTSGASLAALQDDFVRQELNAQQALLRSQEFRDQQADVQAAQARTNQFASNLNSLPDPRSKRGILEILGNAAGSALQTYIGAGGKFDTPKAVTSALPPSHGGTIPPQRLLPSSPTITSANAPRVAGGALRSGFVATLNSTGLFNF